MQLFNFQYAGLIEIHICSQKSKYVLATHGFEIDNFGCIKLNKKSRVRKSYTDLQECILQFNILVKEICEQYGFFEKEWFSKYEFKNLDVDKANALLKELEIDATTDKPMSLAEIYHYDDDNYDNTRKSISF